MRPRPDGHGPKLTDVKGRLKAVLDRVWRYGVRLKSDYAREHADVIAMAASMSLITTKIGEGTFALTWHITIKGQQWLAEQET